MQSRHEHRRTRAGVTGDHGSRIDRAPAKAAWKARPQRTHDGQPPYGGPPRKRHRGYAREAPVEAGQLRVGHLRDLVGFLKDNSDWLVKFGEAAIFVADAIVTYGIITDRKSTRLNSSHL